MKLARALPLCVAAGVTLVLGCHLLAVPVVSRALRPAFPSATPASVGLDYRDLALRGASGARLPAWLAAAPGVAARRGIVLLLAENGGNRASPRMLRLAGEVARMGFEVLLVDLRGHGQSGGVNTYGLGETQDLLAVLDALRREAPERPIAAAGFSMGAACILRAMSMTDSIRAAAAFASYARLDRDLLRHELDYQAGAGSAGRLARLVSPRLLLASLRLWSGLPTLPEPEELRTDRPVLLFHCTGDPEIPFAHAQAIAARARARGVPIELRPVDRAAHLPALEDAAVWDAWLAALRELLDRAMR